MSTKKQEIHESSHIHEHEHEHEHGHPHTHEHEHGHHHKNTKAVLNRMSRAIGHMEAVRTMIEDGRDCSEVLIQIAAVRSAINNIGKIILEDHINHCVVDAVETGDTQVLKDLEEAINKFIFSTFRTAYPVLSRSLRLVQCFICLFKKCAGILIYFCIFRNSDT